MNPKMEFTGEQSDDVLNQSRIGAASGHRKPATATRARNLAAPFYNFGNLRKPEL